jgi:flagellar basal body-associated protein FliL
MSAAKDEHKEEPKAEGGATAPKSKVGVLVAAVVVILGLQAGMTVGVMRYLTPKEKHRPKVAEDTAAADADADADEETGKAEPEMWEKPISKTVTIAGSNAKRYLKATFYLEYDKKKFPKFAADMDKESPRAEFVINQVLSVIPYEEIAKPETQKKACEEILLELNKELPRKTLQVKEVLVTDWLLQ